MTEGKMTIEKARELQANSEEACWFIDGWESRQTEVDELKKIIKRLKHDYGVDTHEPYYNAKGIWLGENR